MSLAMRRHLQRDIIGSPTMPPVYAVEIRWFIWLLQKKLCKPDFLPTGGYEHRRMELKQSYSVLSLLQNPENARR